MGGLTREWTDNPAWCFYDLVTNARYGLGDYIKEADIDKWALYEIAQYCDGMVPDGFGSYEPRFSMNYIITSREEAFKVLNDLSSMFRGITYYAHGSIFAVQDKYRDPVFSIQQFKRYSRRLLPILLPQKRRATLLLLFVTTTREIIFSLLLSTWKMKSR